MSKKIKISISIDENTLDAIKNESLNERRTVSNYIETAINELWLIKELGDYDKNENY